MFGISLPSISDVKNAVTGAASAALHTTEDLGSEAVSHAASLGREGLDLGRSAVNAASHIDVQKVGASVTGAIGKAEDWAENGIRTGVMDAGKGVHSAADFARSHITGNDPLSRLARGGITAAEDVTRFQIGVVGGVGNAAVGLVGSVGQLSVMAAEYQYSPSARAAINDKIVGGLESGAQAVGNYAQSVARDPGRVVGDVEGAAKAGAGWVGGEVHSAEQAIKDGHGPESFGMVAGNAATYLIPVGGEVRAAAGVGEVAARGLTGALAEDGTRALAETGGKTLAEGGARALSETGGKTLAEAGGIDLAKTTTAAASKAGDDYGVAFFGQSNLGYYTRDAATIGREGSSFFLMPLEDSAVVTDAASAARYTGMSPSTLQAYKEGGDIFGLSFPTAGMEMRLPTAADAGGWPHFLEGGHTAVLTGDGPKAGYLVNPTREFVTPGGHAVPPGSVLFKLDGDGAWAPIKRF